MRFATFEHHGEYLGEHRAHRHAGVVSQDNVISLKSAGFADLLSVLRGGSEARAKMEAFVSRTAR